MIFVNDFFIIWNLYFKIKKDLYKLCKIFELYGSLCFEKKFIKFDIV